MTGNLHRLFISNSFMSVDSDSLAAFRKQVSSAKSLDAPAWDASRRLVHSTDWPATRKALSDAIQASSIPDGLKQDLLAALPDVPTTEERPSAAALLKQLTGLPPTKALRALCVSFGVRTKSTPRWPVPTVTPETVDRFIQEHHNPFDLLMEQLPASVLDLGAGDLSFAEELATLYEPSLTAQHRPLILHCLDRLDPSSQLGGPLHAPPLRLTRLRAEPGLQFRFYGDQDMFALDALERDQRLAAKYLIVTCWAPATPTFAYEPSRLSPRCLARELQRTKGDSRQIRHGNEPALEVHHDGRNLLFPPWKFDIRGPLALLEVMAARGTLCVLGAVDSQVCWEIFSQLIDDPHVRPADLVLSPETLPEVFGDIYRRLSSLPVGGSCLLSDVAPLRQRFPSVLRTSPGGLAPYRFRQVRIQRGALFEGIPASSTARRFQDMAEETPPWLLTLVPEPI